MVSLGEVQARVAARYERLRMPSWPDPHPWTASPRGDQYSRVTEPERYRIVHARARVWAEMLGAVPGVEAETLPPAALGDRFQRGVRLISSTPGTLPLLLLEQDVRLPEHDASLAVLHISIVRPDVAVAMLPDCGCDACDMGSADLLRAIDETISHIVGGPFVALRGKGWQAQWHPTGGSVGGAGRVADDAQAILELCRRLAAGEGVRLPQGTDAFVGRPWLR